MLYVAKPTLSHVRGSAPHNVCAGARTNALRSSAMKYPCLVPPGTLAKQQVGIQHCVRNNPNRRAAAVALHLHFVAHTSLPLRSHFTPSPTDQPAMPCANYKYKKAGARCTAVARKRHAGTRAAYSTSSSRTTTTQDAAQTVERLEELSALGQDLIATAVRAGPRAPPWR